MPSKKELETEISRLNKLLEHHLEVAEKLHRIKDLAEVVAFADDEIFETAKSVVYFEIFKRLDDLLERK